MYYLYLRSTTLKFQLILKKSLKSSKITSNIQQPSDRIQGPGIAKFWIQGPGEAILWTSQEAEVEALLLDPWIHDGYGVNTYIVKLSWPENSTRRRNYH